MHFNELQKKSLQEVQEMLRMWRHELVKVSANIATGQERDVRRVRELRRDIARAKTLLTI